MLRSILLKTLRDQRRAVLGWGLGAGLIVLGVAAGWARAYPDQPARERLAREVSGSLSMAQMIFGEPHDLERLGGFVGWRALGMVPVLLGLFMVLAATGATRGAEERGELEVVLVAGRGRARLFAEQAGGLMLALTLTCILVWVALLLCGPAANADALSPARSALAMLNVGLAAALFGAIGLLAAQVARTRRAAALTAATVMFAAHIWANLGLVATSLRGARRLSPLYLYGRSTPLADGHVDVPALALLALLGVGCVVLAGWLFARRDLGAAVRIPAPRPLRALADTGMGALTGGGRSNWLLGSSLGCGVRTALGSTLAWGLALAAYAALIVAVAPIVRKAYEDEAQAQEFFARIERGDIGTESGFITIGLLTLLTLLVGLFATTLASAWASEEQAGRLEVELAAPLSRRRYFAERAGAALVAVFVLVALIGVGFFVSAWLAGVDVPWGRALAAVALLAPLAGIVAAFGYAVSAWRPGAVTTVVGLALAGSFFLDLFAPLFNLPDAVRELSVFHLYGQPLTDGVRWAGLAAEIVLIAAFFFLGSVAFSRRDIAK